MGLKHPKSGALGITSLGRDVTGRRERNNLTPSFVELRMKTLFAPLQALLLTSLVAAPLARVYGQTAPASDPLFQTIQSLDTQLFEAYNHCDLEKFGSLLADDLEFYHDVGG